MSNVDQHAAGTPAWFDLMTPDLDGAKKFYGELFGWTFVGGDPNMGYYTMCQLGGRNAAGMGKRDENAPYPTVWSVYFDSKDVDAHAAAIKENGGNVMMGPMDVMDAGRMLVATDSTGAAFGFWQGKQHLGAQVVNEHGAMTWCEVNTRDADKACAFYGKVLGAETKKIDGGMDYWTIGVGGKEVAGIMKMTEQWGDLPPHWMVYFAVDDSDAAAEKVKSLGGKCMHGPFDTPYGRIAVVADPYGAVFSVIKLAKPA